MVKGILYFSIIFFVFMFPVPLLQRGADIRTGDIVFQESRSVQGKAVKFIAGGKYSHAGIIVVYGGRIMVLEAAARVKLSEFQTFVNRGTGRHYIVKRLKDYNTLINDKSLKNLQRIARRFIGKRYDYLFQWDDRMVYSAELVWKVFYRGLGVRLSGFTRLGNLDLTHSFTAVYMENEFGVNIPLDEPVLTPEMLLKSGKLVTVYEN